MKCHDIIIIGAGISAGPAIEEISSKLPGRSVLVIERGTHTSKEPLKKIRLRNENGIETLVDQWWSSPEIGGASRLWYGQLSRFEETDFEPTYLSDDHRSQIGENWPVKLDHLSRYYEDIERKLRPFSGDAALNRVLKKDNENCIQRSELANFERKVFDLLEGNGWNPYGGKTCLGGHGWFGQPIDPKTLSNMDLKQNWSHDRNWIFRSLQNIKNSELIEYTDGIAAVNIKASGGGYQLTCVDAYSNKFEFWSKYILLACGVLTTTKLLAKFFRDENTGLGRGFTFTNEATAYIGTDISRSCSRDELIGRFANISSKHLYNLDVSDANCGGKVSIYDARSFEGDLRHERKMASLLEDQDVSSISPVDKVTLKISFKGRSEPSDDKYLFFDEDAHIHYVPTALDKLTIEEVHKQFNKLAAIFPGGKLLGATDNVFGHDYTSAHLHGGAIFGQDDTASVLNPKCEVWNAPGLFVLDGSFMPGSGSTNSSHTIMANSLRVSSHIVETLM